MVVVEVEVEETLLSSTLSPLVLTLITFFFSLSFFFSVTAFNVHGVSFSRRQLRWDVFQELVPLCLPPSLPLLPPSLPPSLPVLFVLEERKSCRPPFLWFVLSSNLFLFPFLAPSLLPSLPPSLTPFFPQSLFSFISLLLVHNESSICNILFAPTFVKSLEVFWNSVCIIYSWRLPFFF